MRTITCKGGPLDGKSYDIPDTQTEVTTDGGIYKVTPTSNRAAWAADKAKPKPATKK
jgi:hypothetical protein